MKKIISVPLEQDLKPLSVLWHQQGVRHRIVEEQGLQVVYALDEDDVEHMLKDYGDFSEGRLRIQLEKISPEGGGLRPLELVSRFPVTSLLFALSIVGFLLVQFNVDAAIGALVIQDMDYSGMPALIDIPQRISTAEYLAHGQYWRLVTPIFLHFGWLHITFNMLWLWELGRRIEDQVGSLHLLSIVLCIGIASNLYQAQSTPTAYFGGMSGVIYGLLGYCAVFNLISPNRQLQLPMAIYIFMLLSLAAGFLGIFDFLAEMANTAHLSGLVLGLVMGALSALVYRFIPAR